MSLLIGYVLPTALLLGWKYHLIWRMPNDVGHGSRSSPGAQWPRERASLSPSVLMCQCDSTVACARTALSAIPHLHAAHWMISSVVPVKSPVTRDSYFWCHVGSNASLAARCTGPSGLVWFSLALSGRGSNGARCARRGDVASEGRGAPGAEVVKYPPSGAGDVRSLPVVSATPSPATRST